MSVAMFQMLKGVNTVKKQSRLKNKLMAAKTPEEIAAIAKEAGEITELSVDDLDQIASGTGEHTHVWHNDIEKFGGLLRTSYCSCGARAYFVSGREIAEDEYFDIYVHLQSIMPKMENS